MPVLPATFWPLCSYKINSHSLTPSAVLVITCHIFKKYFSVQTSDGDTDDFPIRIGLHQGSALSPYLFALVMYEVTRDTQGDIPWCMLFADDVVLVDESRT